MQILNTFRAHHTRSLLWLISISLVLMIAGCSKKDAAIESLRKNKIALTADNLGFYSSKGDLEKVKLLLDAGVDVNAIGSTGSSALISASWAGKQEVVSYLLEAKANVNTVSLGKPSALIVAINQKQEKIALSLIEHGANPNVVDSTGTSPLIVAAWQGDAALVRALTEKGADVNYKRPSDGLTAKKAAVAAGKLDIAQHLKSRGATD